MSKSDFRQLLPNIDATTEWFLKETVYCLVFYADMSEDDAHKVLIASNLIDLVKDDPQWMWREPAFHWAMCILHGFDAYWWHDKQLWKLHNDYVRERHHPPIGK